MTSTQPSPGSPDATTRSMRVAVVGGTGLVGQFVTAALAGAGHRPVVVARSRGVDVTTGRGLDAALAGCAAVVDVGNVPTLSGRTSVAWFEAATTHVLAAARRAGVEHLVTLSIVGADRVRTGYYAGKLRQEDLVRGGDVPWTVLRATQFHEFAGQLLDRFRGPVALVPRMRVRTVAAAEVAEHLAAIAVGPARGVAVPVAGPAEHEVVDVARAVLSARRSRRLVVPVRLPGATGRALAGGALLPAGPVVIGRQTVEEYLAGIRAGVR